jgi:hypothetical protein
MIFCQLTCLLIVIISSVITLLPQQFSALMFYLRMYQLTWTSIQFWVSVLEHAQHKLTLLCCFFCKHNMFLHQSIHAPAYFYIFLVFGDDVMLMTWLFFYLIWTALKRTFLSTFLEQFDAQYIWVRNTSCVSISFLRSTFYIMLYTCDICAGFSEKQGKVAPPASFDISTEWDIWTMAEDTFHHCYFCCRSVFDTAG